MVPAPQDDMSIEDILASYIRYQHREDNIGVLRDGGDILDKTPQVSAILETHLFGNSVDSRIYYAYLPPALQRQYIWSHLNFLTEQFRTHMEGLEGAFRAMDRDAWRPHLHSALVLARLEFPGLTQATIDKALAKVEELTSHPVYFLDLPRIGMRKAE